MRRELPSVIDMSDDPAQIREQARQAARLATEARSAAKRVTGNGAVKWRSEGAERYRKKLADRSRDFRSRADDLDELSRDLGSHARHVEDHERTIGKVVDTVKDAVDPWGLL